MSEDIKQNGTTPVEEKVIEQSFQRRVDQPQQGIFRWWFSQPDDGSGISNWWSPQRDNDLREFWMKPGNDILQGAISSLVKWGTTLPYTIEGPKRRLPIFQNLLSQSEFGQGWATLLSKTLQDYYSQDKGATWELIGGGQPDGVLEGQVIGIAHLDSQFVQPTGDPVYPIIYLNPKDGKPHKIHATRVVRFVDMPSPNETMPGIGFCAVSRVIASSMVLLKLAQYKNEKLSDMPEAGLLLLNNVLPSQWEDATSDHQRGRRKLGHEIWSNILTLFSIDPAQPATANFVDFSSLPEGFNELQSTNLYVNIVALAFGVDPREFWPMTGGALGTAREAETMSQKAKGKGKGDVISMFERAINWHILPENIEFAFDNQDDQEDELRARINETKVKTIMSMYLPDLIMNGIEPPVTTLEVRQMLADNVPDYFKEEFLLVDISDEEEVTDTEKQWKIDSKGFLHQPRTRKAKDLVLEIAEKNYKEGKISLDELTEFRLGQILDDTKYNSCHDAQGRFCSTGAGITGGISSEKARQNVIKGIMATQAHGLATGNEAITGYDAQGNQIDGMPTGNNDSISNPDPVLTNDTHVFVHNHPTSSAFSGEDINTFSNLNAQHMIVVGHDGTLYKLSKPEGWQSLGGNYDYNYRYSSIKESLMPKYAPRVLERGENANVVWKEHSHEILTRLAQEHGFNYTRVLPRGSNL